MRTDVLLTVQLWRDEGGAAPWRARVTDLRTGAVRAFPDVAGLLRFLGATFGSDADPSPGAAPPPGDA